jgi:hypothetical protein
MGEGLGVYGWVYSVWLWVWVWVWVWVWDFYYKNMTKTTNKEV